LPIPSFQRPWVEGLLYVAANSLWCLSCLPDSLVFHLARRDVAGTQRKLLLHLLRRNAETQFGRRHRFATIRSVAEYQARVPLSTYDDYHSAIEQIRSGQPKVLTRDPVLLLEPTSGSTAATKHIPYTARLKTEFVRAIAAWMVDLYSHDPRLLLGQVYWSITPVTQRNELTCGGIPIGFEEDSEYLGGWHRHLIQSVQAVPSLVRLIENMEAFRYTTLLFLLRSRSLTLISAWNPTFLILLIERLSDWWPQLADDIDGGTLSPPNSLAPGLKERFNKLNTPDRRRALEIRAAFQASGNLGNIHSRLWPRLRLISCWTNAHAALHGAQLLQLFPQARLQGKGLMATEGFVSFPLVGASLAGEGDEGHMLAIRSHFFEFLPINDDQSDGGELDPSRLTPAQAHELELGGCYAVVITTGGGLYRYQLHDIVEVVGHRGNCPLLRFVGKESYISDRFGEKLNERHVRQALGAVLTCHGIQPAFAMVACEEERGRAAYTLFVEAERLSEGLLRSLGSDLELALQDNYHYRYCRDLGQLNAVRVFQIEDGALETYLSVCQAHGQRAGDIKPVALHRLGGWMRAFRGRTIT
jgi:hypothetical protein